MTISEKPLFLGLPLEARSDLPPQYVSSVRVGRDFYGEMGADNISGILTVESTDDVSIRGVNQFSDKHFYHGEEINNLHLTRMSEQKRLFVKEHIVWRRE